MSCEQTTRDELAEKYVAARLLEPQLEEFEIHILECPRCRTQVEMLQGLQAELALHPAKVTALRASFFPWPRWAWSAVAALLLVGAAAVWINQQRFPRTAPTVAVTTSPQSVSRPPEALNGRNYVELPLATSAPKKTQSAAKKGPPAHIAAPAGATESPLPGQEERAGQAAAPEVAGPASEKPEALRAGSGRKATAPVQPVMSQELAAELFRLGQADPPPYTFAGFSSSGKQDGPDRTGPTMGVVVPSAQVGRRQVFANAMAAYIEGRYSAALPLLEQAVEAEPAAPDVSFFLGVCRLQLGHPKEASAQFTRAIQLGPSLYLEGAHFYLAKAYIQMNQLDGAEDELQAVIRLKGRRSAEAEALLVRLRALRSALQESRTAPRTPGPPR